MTLTLVAAQVGVFNRNITALLAETGGVIEQMLGWKKLELLSEQSAPPSPNFYTNQNTGMFFWSGLKSRLDRCASVMALSKVSLSMPAAAAASQG